MLENVIIITGPTACGKTAEALKLAQEIDAEIISCDSILVYKYADIGSAKPSKEELSKVPHHLIDIAEPSKQFNIADYISHAKSAFEDILNRGKKVIVAGGSGFYLKSWFSAVTDELEIPQEIKDFTAAIEKQGGAELLALELLKLDSEAYKIIDMKNPRRTKNALERVLASKKSVKDALEHFKNLPCPMGEISRDLRIIDKPDFELKNSISLRAKNMLDKGLIEEVEKLISLGFENNASLSNSVGYREVLEWVKQGRATSLDDLHTNIVKSTFSLVKKQRKFFRNNLIN